MSSEVDRIRNGFPDDLQKLLDFFEKGDYVIAKPKHYLAGEDFKAIATIVKEFGGDYISAGKESHFKIPKPKNAESQFVREAVDMLKRHTAEINELLQKFKEPETHVR